MTRTQIECLAVAIYESNARATAKREDAHGILRLWSSWPSWHELPLHDRTVWRGYASALEKEPL